MDSGKNMRTFDIFRVQWTRRKGTQHLTQSYLTPVQWDVMVLITEKYCIKAEKCGPEGANFYAKSIKRFTDKSIQYLQLE